MDLGKSILCSSRIYLIGRYVIKFVNKLVRKVMEKKRSDLAIRTFVGSLVNISLRVLLIISVVGALGVETTSFAALLASLELLSIWLLVAVTKLRRRVDHYCLNPIKLEITLETQTARNSQRNSNISYNINYS